MRPRFVRDSSEIRPRFIRDLPTCRGCCPFVNELVMHSFLSLDLPQLLPRRHQTLQPHPKVDDSLQLLLTDARCEETPFTGRSGGRPRFSSCSQTRAVKRRRSQGAASSIRSAAPPPLASASLGASAPAQRFREIPRDSRRFPEVPRDAPRCL